MNTCIRHIEVFVITVLLLLATSASAQYSENVIFEFHNSDGSFPDSLIRDGAGNFYGVTASGGKKLCSGEGCGVVFKLSNSSGTWVRTILHAFTGAADGYNPLGIAIDSHGNLFGTANGGGANCCGVAYELSPSTGGAWKFTVLHSFPQGAQDGKFPDGAAIGPDGNFYAVTQIGGSGDCGGSGCGTVFKLSPTPTGQWKETILHRFSHFDGQDPFANLVFDSTGNVFGVTDIGGPGCGSSGCGVAFELSPTATGWTETILHRFIGGIDGAYPGSPVLDASGNLFGVTLQGASTNCSGGCGTVFELSPSVSGWTYSQIWAFGNTGDGAFPQAVAPDSTGNIFGITTLDASIGEGTAFELSPNSSGGFGFNLLYAFSDPTGGAAPTAILVDPSGNLFGTTESGGDVSHTSSGDGVAFELSPSSTTK